MRRQPFWIFLALLFCLACGDGYPPCAPEGNGPGTIYGPTPSPLPGPGGPNEPPDWADQPPKYSKNAEGEVCTCGPYQPGCTSDPDGVEGDENPGYSSFPNACDPNCSSGAPGNGAEDTAPDPLAGGFSPSVFKFIQIIADDGMDVAGGWQEAAAQLKFFRWTSILPESWSCSIRTGMPLRTEKYGIIFADSAAAKTAQIATDAAHNLAPKELLPAVYCKALAMEMMRLFGIKYPQLGARVTSP